MVKLCWDQVGHILVGLDLVRVPTRLDCLEVWNDMVGSVVRRKGDSSRCRSTQLSCFISVLKC
jgi:hypothetical protein